MKLQAALLCLLAVSAQSVPIIFDFEDATSDGSQFDSRNTGAGDELPFAPFLVIENPFSLFLREVAMQQQEEFMRAVKPVTQAQRYSDSVPAEQPHMLSQVAKLRFEDAMSDCNKMHNMKRMDIEDDGDEGAGWFDVASDDFSTAQGNGPFAEGQFRGGFETSSSFLLSSIWNSMAELDRKAQQMSLPDMGRMSQQTSVPDMFSRSQQIFFFEPDVVDDVAASIIIEGGPMEQTIIVFGEANDEDATYMPDSRMSFLDYHQGTGMEQVGPELEWGREGMMSMPDLGVPSVVDMLLLTMLLMGAALVMANFVYNWLQLRSTMAASEATPPGMVQVMFEHNGQRVRGYMTLADLEEGQAEGKGSTKPPAQAGSRRPRSPTPKEGEVVVAADLV